MRLATRGLLAAAVIAVSFAASTPANAGPAVCITYQDHTVASGGPAGTVVVPAPTRVELNCTVQAVLELVGQ